MPTTATTTLPDEQAPTLQNGVEDEIAVNRAEVTNNGDVRYQLRRSADAPDWSSAASFTSTVETFDTLSFIFAGLLDGEKYDVRGRTETAYRTGAYTTPTSITTKFPGATNLTATATGTASVDLSWTDNADNEAGQRVVRERQDPDGSYGRKRVVADAGSNTEAFTDTTAQPDRTYRYRIRPFTDYTTSESNTDTTRTDALGDVRDRRVPPGGWYAEVEHPSGETLTPTVLDGSEWSPRLNAKPQARIRVPRSATWEDAPVEGSAIRVWLDGTRLPIEEVRSVERNETADAIVAVGGVALTDDIEGVSFPEKDAHVAAEQIITNELGWVANVDNPQTDTRSDVRLFQANASADFDDDAIEERPFPATSPLTVFNGEVFAEQTGFFIEGEDASGDGTTFFADAEGNAGAWSGGESIRLQPGEIRTFDITTDYVIPQNDGRAVLVYAAPTDPTPGLEIRIDVGGGGTTTLESFGSGALSSSSDQFDLNIFGTTINPSSVGDLPSGSHTLEVENKSTNSNDIYIDWVHIRDDRFAYDTSDTTPSSDVVTGWEQRPADIDVTFAPVSSVEQVVAGEVDVTLSGGGAPVALGLRNDTTNAFDEATNVTTHTVDFASASQLIQARVTLGREDSGSTSGNFGDEPHRLDVIDVFADLVNTPVLIDFNHAGTIERLLNRIADAGDSIWEVRRAPSQPEPYRVEWTQPGQRVADGEPALVSFDGRRTIEGAHQRVIAQGKTQRVEEQTFTTPSSYGLRVGLGNEPIEVGSETVYDVGDRTTQYERGIDYQIDRREGAIEILSGGSMATDTDYQIDYAWRYEGRYTDPGATDPETLRESFPDATSDRECEQVALAVVREVSDPLEEVAVTIRDPDPDRSLVAAIDPDRLPFDGPLRVRDVSSTRREITLQLGSRDDPREVVAQLTDRLRAVARNI